MKLFISQLRQIIVEETKEALQEIIQEVGGGDLGWMVQSSAKEAAAKQRLPYESGIDLEEEKDDKWIQKAVPEDDPDRGKFSAAAKKAGMDTCAYAIKIKNSDTASKKQKARAQFALNAGCKEK